MAGGDVGHVSETSGLRLRDVSCHRSLRPLLVYVIVRVHTMAPSTLQPRFPCALWTTKLLPCCPSSRCVQPSEFPRGSLPGPRGAKYGTMRPTAPKSVCAAGLCARRAQMPPPSKHSDRDRCVPNEPCMSVLSATGLHGRLQQPPRSVRTWTRRRCTVLCGTARQMVPAPLLPRHR